MRGWIAEESFWRDVTTRAIAAAIVGVGAYLYALGAGYLSTPSGAQAMKGVLNVVVWPLVGFSTVWIAELIGRRLRKSRYAKLADLVASLPVLLMMLVVTLALIHLFVWALPFWPFNTAGWHAGTPRLF